MYDLISIIRQEVSSFLSSLFLIVIQIYPYKNIYLQYFLKLYLFWETPIIILVKL